MLPFTKRVHRSSNRFEGFSLFSLAYVVPESPIMHAHPAARRIFQSGAEDKNSNVVNMYTQNFSHRNGQEGPGGV